MLRSWLHRYGGAALCALLAFGAALLGMGDDANAQSTESKEQTKAAEQAPVQQPAPEITGPAKLMPSVRPDFTAIGSEMCGACHPERLELSGTVRHLRILLREEEKGRFGGCEACHGRGSGHLETADPAEIFGSTDTDNSWVGDSCFVCHTNLEREPWLESPHWMSGVTCNDCHSMHEPESGPKLLKYNIAAGEKECDLCFKCHKTSEAPFRAYSHHPVFEGRVTCSDCHNLHDPSVIEVDGSPMMEPCLKCHRDKQPPFAFEHEPVTGDLADGCLTCHISHGSPNQNLLRLPGRALCLQCHTEQAAGHFGGTTCWSNGCHRMVHGSNADPLFFN